MPPPLTLFDFCDAIVPRLQSASHLMCERIDYMNELVIQTDGLTKRYGDILAVDDLSLEVPRGHVFGLLGPNGSGKTTTMCMLLGLVKPTGGSFSLFGGRITHRDALHRVGAIVETPSFYPYLSGRDNLAYYQGISGRGDRKELDDLLGKVGLAERACGQTSSACKGSSTSSNVASRSRRSR